jgi:hypothetical protein
MGNKIVTSRAKAAAVVLRESGGPSIPEKSVVNRNRRGVLDRPVKPDDDSGVTP